MNAFRRALKRRASQKPMGSWLNKALVELDAATQSPHTLRFHRADANDHLAADAAVDKLVPLIEGAGHTVVNVSGGGWNPGTYITVVPRHLVETDLSVA